MSVTDTEALAANRSLADLTRRRDEMRGALDEMFQEAHAQVVEALEGAVNRHHRRQINQAQARIGKAKARLARMLERKFNELTGAYDPEAGTFEDVQAEAEEMLAGIFG